MRLELAMPDVRGFVRSLVRVALSRGLCAYQSTATVLPSDHPVTPLRACSRCQQVDVGALADPISAWLETGW
jgi:hypothetical protein